MYIQGQTITLFPIRIVKVHSKSKYHVNLKKEANRLTVVRSCVKNSASSAFFLQKVKYVKVSPTAYS